MKIVIDRDLCEANGVCMDYAPKVFDIDDDDVLHINEAEITKTDRKDLDAAVRRCPRGALSVEE